MLKLKLKLQYFGHLMEQPTLIGKVPDAGKDGGPKEKKVSEDEMAGWHHWCNGHELRQTSGGHEGQGGLTWFHPWDHKELDLTGQLTTEILKFRSIFSKIYFGCF